MFTIELIERALGKTLSGQPRGNAMSVVVAPSRFDAATGLDLTHREVQLLAQLAHESMGFVYDKEIWGPTDAQRRYDVRTDLGNTAAVDGDGFLYRGRGPIQVTGKTNYRLLRDWVRATVDPSCPDFVAQPDLVNTDPWEGPTAIWYWSTRTNAGKSMNAYADAGDVEMITRMINGGTNGLADRLNWYVRFGLVALGYGPTEIRSFQTAAQTVGLYPKPLILDGVAGGGTRKAIHDSLKLLAAKPADAPPATGQGGSTEPPTLSSLDARMRNLEQAVAGLLDAA